MQKKILLCFFVFIITISVIYVGNYIESQAVEYKPTVFWYIVGKHLDNDFKEAAEKYKPDIILLTVYAEDDIIPFYETDEFDLKKFIDEMHDLGIKVYYSFSLWSRSALPREEYDKLKDQGIPYSEQKIHMADYSRYLREANETKYHELYDYYFENGLNPENIPKVKRKPVNGFFIPPGHYTSIDPTYKPYQDYMINVINKTIQIAKPDGLAFDHIRFFTFDDGYNQDIRNYILENSGLDIYNYTPKPIFQLNNDGWKEEDRLYYYARAKLISQAVDNITSKFPGFKKYGTTMGMTNPARSVGQYVELQSTNFDGLLLMAYDEDSSEIARNVNETIKKIEKSGTELVLGIFQFNNDNIIYNNIKAGLKNKANGIYLLGYKFSENVHRYLQLI